MKKKNALVFLAACAAIVSTTAGGTTLNGVSGTVEFDFPTLGTVFSGDGGPVAFTGPVAPPGILLNTGFAGAPNGALVNTISGANIDINFLVAGHFLGDPTFDGEVFKLPTFTITSLSVSQNVGAQVSWDAHDIYVNFVGDPFTTSSFVDLTVNSAPVPLPGAALLMLSGLVGVGALVRRSKAIA